MAKRRRRIAPPAPALPQVAFTPGLAQETLRELAPLLAEEGIDVGHIDALDLPTLQRALDRAVERHNLARFTPVGPARERALATLRQAVGALATGESARAGAILDAVPPESSDQTCATVAGCIGVALGLLDDWLSGRGPAPDALGDLLPPLLGGRHRDQAAATDILTLARKGRAFRSLGQLIVSRGGEQVLHGSTLALTTVVQTWSDTTETALSNLIGTVIR